MVKIVTKYIAEGGKEFESQAAAEKYEQEQLGRAEINYRNYLTSYSGSRLIKELGLDAYGVWEILGEDDNPDMGGPHHMPSLGFYEGTLEQAIRKAVSIPRFYSWGGGGNIKFYKSPLIEKL